MTHEMIQPDTLHPTVGYTHGARAGQLLFVAGQVALDRETNVVGGADVEAQARQVYRNLTAVLEAAGGSLADVVKMTTYLTNAEHIERWRAARNSAARRARSTSNRRGSIRNKT